MFARVPFHHAGNPVREPFQESIVLWTEQRCTASFMAPAVGTTFKEGKILENQHFGSSRNDKGTVAPIFWSPTSL